MLPDTTAAAADKIRCDACPVMCYIKPGAAGACDRYANHYGVLVRVDPHVVLERTVSHGGRLVPFQTGGDWDGKIVREPSVFVTAIGAQTDIAKLPCGMLPRSFDERSGFGVLCRDNHRVSDFGYAYDAALLDDNRAANVNLL